ncbi:MAG: hypothetical protein ACREAA_03940 [Candidatus Polarisedimenticolia bacterium]
MDLVRLAEAFRLKPAVQGSVWPGWEATPFPVLLVGPEREFLVGYPRTPPGFADAGYSGILHTPISTRARQLQPDLLATFPAFGPPSVVVVGRAEALERDVLHRELPEVRRRAVLPVLLGTEGWTVVLCGLSARLSPGM